MHEYEVTKKIVDIAVREAEAAGASSILEIKLVIGDLSSIIDESVNMYFDIIAEGTLAQGARLVFKRMPARFRCEKCGNIYDKPVRGFECPLCNSMGRLDGGGKEFYIESMEVE